MKNLLLVVFFLVLCMKNSFAPPGNWYSRLNGDYATASTWSAISHSGPAVGSPLCSCTPCKVTANNYIEITHQITASCDLEYSGNPTVVIKNGGSLTVSGNASVSGAVIFIIDSGATVHVSGDFDVNGAGGMVTVNGVLDIDGDMTITGSFPVCGTGQINIGGSLNGSVCGTIILPVTWLSIYAKYKSKFVDIGWTTASEINNDYFTVEKSNDGRFFSFLDQVKGAGNSTAMREYNSADNSPAIGINYYRVKQTDYDGKYDYSGIVAVYVSKSGEGITITPNLVSNGSVNIIFTGMKNNSAYISLFDINGKLIQRQKTVVNSNSAQFIYRFPEALSCATYFINIVSGEFMDTQKVTFGAQK